MSYQEFLKKYNIKDSKHPKHFYDYEAAYNVGAKPDKDGHWPSKFKHDLHPNRYIIEEDSEGRQYFLDTKNDTIANEQDVIMQKLLRMDYLNNYKWEGVII